MQASKITFRSVLLLIYLGFYVIAFGQVEDLSFFDYLNNQETVNVQVTFDMKAIWKKSDKYLPADIVFEIDGDQRLEFKGEIRSRGNVRKEICTNPPMKLRFKKNDLKQRGFIAYKTLKIVNPCSLNESNLDYLNLEYGIYKAYFEVTDMTFRVKKVTVNYVDRAGKRKPIQTEAIIIEHEDNLAARFDGKIFETTVTPERIFDRESVLVFALFQYMVGNTDWSYVKAHNCIMIRNEKMQKIYPVAYDFDYAGMVNAHYAIPAEKLGIDNVRERIYRGPCFTEDEWASTSSIFIEKKEKIQNIFASLPLAKSRANSTNKYLEDFFDSLENERFCRNTFINCK